MATQTMSLSQALQKLFGTTTVYQPFGAPDVTGLPHNGIDIGLNAGANVPAIQGGTVVVDQGQQVAIRTPAGIIESYLHINPNNLLSVGAQVGQGQSIGTIGSQTGTAASGWEYSVGGYNYWSTTPHLHFAEVATVQQAVTDTGGVNPVGLLEAVAPTYQGTQPSQQAMQQQAAGQQGANVSGGNGANTTPVIGGIVASTGVIGNFFDNLFGSPPIVGPNSLTSNPGGLIASGIGNLISGEVKKYLVLILIALVALVVLAALLRDTPVAEAVKA